MPWRKMLQYFYWWLFWKLDLDTQAGAHTAASAASNNREPHDHTWRDEHPIWTSELNCIHILSVLWYRSTSNTVLLYPSSLPMQCSIFRGGGPLPPSVALVNNCAHHADYNDNNAVINGTNLWTASRRSGGRHRMNAIVCGAYRMQMVRSCFPLIYWLLYITFLVLTQRATKFMYWRRTLGIVA